MRCRSVFRPLRPVHAKLFRFPFSLPPLAADRKSIIHRPTHSRNSFRIFRFSSRTLFLRQEFSTRSRQPCLFFFSSTPVDIVRYSSARLFSFPFQRNFRRQHFAFGKNFFIRLEASTPPLGGWLRPNLFSSAKYLNCAQFGRQRWSEKSLSYLHSSELLSTAKISNELIQSLATRGSVSRELFTRFHRKIIFFLHFSNVKIFSSPLVLLG